MTGQKPFYKSKGPKVLPVVLLLLLTVAGCKKDKLNEMWDVNANVTAGYLTIKATIADYHGDFIHMSIRRKGWRNGYSVERSPAENQPKRDWSRVHHWFGQMHPNTYLEGRIDDGSGEGPFEFTTYMFKLPVNKNSATRQNFPDKNGSDYQYITRGYYYADGNPLHPSFPPGSYEIEIYPWYTGSANGRHPSKNDNEEVQYIHYEQQLASTTFVIK